MVQRSRLGLRLRLCYAAYTPFRLIPFRLVHNPVLPKLRNVIFSLIFRKLVCMTSFISPCPTHRCCRACERSGAKRERLKFPLTAHASFCNPRSPLRDLPAPAPFPLQRIFSRPAPAPLPLIQFSDPLRSAPHRGVFWSQCPRKIYVKGKMD